MTQEGGHEDVSSADLASLTESVPGVSEHAKEHAEVLSRLEDEALNGAAFERPSQKAWADGFAAVTRMLAVSTTQPPEGTPVSGQ